MYLTTLAQHCAPMVAPQTMSAIVRVESGGDPLAMWNNTSHQRILPQNLTTAEAYLRTALALGQKVDVGIAQVDTENFAAFGLTPDNVFNACTNLHVGGEILRADYQRAALRYGPGQFALYHAFEAYNSGHLWGAETQLRKPLIFLLARPQILGFFADWKYSGEGLHHFELPTRVLARNARKQRRVPIEGNILMRAKNGRTLYGKLHDFSPGGASMFLDQDILEPGEMVLVEFEIPECGICETVATIARRERITHPIYPYLYGIYFQLTEAQQRKAEHLYLCKKAEQIKKVVNSARDRFSGKTF